MLEVEFEQKRHVAMTIDELYNVYRSLLLRHKARLAERREHFTLYYCEGSIVAELNKHKAANKTEQFKKDYCTLTYENELENPLFVFDVPVSVYDDKFNFDLERDYSQAEPSALIKIYVNFRDIAERELSDTLITPLISSIKLTTTHWFSLLQQRLQNCA